LSARREEKGGKGASGGDRARRGWRQQSKKEETCEGDFLTGTTAEKKNFKSWLTSMDECKSA
jgi:hypothetical protein